MEDTKQIVITGATGFIGQHLLEDLLPLNYRITIITRDPNKSVRVKSDKIKVIKADLNDEGSLVKAFEGADVVVNLAAELRQLDVIEKTNVQGTHYLVNALKMNNVKQCIHLSSVGVVGMQYSMKPVEVTENSECDPKNDYERTKLASEQILKNAVKDSDCNLSILRPTNVFGEHHPKKALFQLFSKLKSSSFFVTTNAAVVNYVYVKDVTAVIINAIQNPVNNGIYNIGESMSMKEFVLTFSKIIGKKTNVIVLPKFLFGFLNLFGVSKLKALSNAVSYSDKKLKVLIAYPFGIEKGLKRTFEGLK
ncbi:MAG: NAD-dependent epimerase/dehydratase family protein [Sphingobacteriaceae bacterium]